MLVTLKKQTFYSDHGQKKKIKALKKKFHTNLFKQILMGMSE